MEVDVTSGGHKVIVFTAPNGRTVKQFISATPGSTFRTIDNVRGDTRYALRSIGVEKPPRASVA
jgi:hypothetical protein